MSNNLTLERSIIINAATARVWKALTDPAEIKQYLFGTETITDWKVGSRIIYKGVWQGKEYEDGGTILQFEPEKIFQSTYWSSMSGTEDKPENYATVTYTIEERSGDGTLLKLTQNNIKTEESKKHLEENWDMVLNAIKKVIEESPMV